MSCDVAPFDDIEGVCGICKKGLRGGQTRWCSKVHARLFYQNHYWTQARSAAKRRDRYQCVRVELPEDPTLRYYGARFFNTVRCVKKPLEVNHIAPLRDADGHPGYDGANCIHHQTNLETLCHAHHVIETNRQREERRATVVAAAEVLRYATV